MWRARICFFADSAETLRIGRGLFASAYGGTDSIPEPLRCCSCVSRLETAFCHDVNKISSPFTVATAVLVVTGERVDKPDVWYSKKLPINASTMNHQMYFATLRIDCRTTGRDSFGSKERGMPDD